jgi:hypothetical protein
MTSKAFWLAAGERALKTAAQTLLLLWAADGGFDLFHVNVQESLGMGAGAAVLSVLTSVASSGIGDPGPSLTTERLP